MSELKHFSLHCSIGQTKPVHVYQMIAENTVESKVCLNLDQRAPGRSRFTEIVPGFQVMDIQEKKKKLIKEVSI